MPKPLKPIIFMVLLLAVGLFSSFNPTFAADTESSHITETVLFGNLKDDGSACGVFTVLNLVVDIFSITVGVLAVIGITIVGIKYLTAGGNEEQTRKAKQRMLQIVIGLVAYAVIYVGLQWLMPGGKLDFGKRCATISNEELANIKAQEKAEREAQIEADRNNRGTSTSSGSATGTNSSAGGTSTANQLLSYAHEYAAKLEESGIKYCNTGGNSTWANAKKHGCLNCAEYVSLVAQKAGIMKSGKSIWIGYGKVHNKGNLISSKVTIKQNVNKTVSNLYKNKQLVPGDIVGSQSGTPHTMIFKGYSNGKYYFYSVNSKYSGVSAKTHTLKKSWVENKTYSGNYKIGVIIRAK